MKLSKEEKRAIAREIAFNAICRYSKSAVQILRMAVKSAREQQSKTGK